MKWKDFFNEYLSFSRKDRIAVIIITVVILSVFLIPAIVNKSKNVPAIESDTAWMASLKKLEQNEKQYENTQNWQNGDENNNYSQYDRKVNNYSGKNKGELFYFDPNTLTKDGWQKLGIRDKTITTILNYRSKGGQFRKPEDVQKIYGLFPNEYERIAPYIKIEDINQTTGKKDFIENNNYTPKTYAPRFTVIDVNIADTTAFISLPGIGSKLAARIINFRDKLGGFYSISQVAETFGLPDSTFQKMKQYLKLENKLIRKININKATVDELKNHPYIRYTLANPIIAYRNEHGPFARIEDIKKVMVVTDEVYNKIFQYLSVQ